MSTDLCRTIVVGASKNPERYSYLAMKMLRDYGHPVVGVHPKLIDVEGVEIFPDIAKAAAALGEVDTITMYVGEARSTPLVDAIVGAKPKRVVFNPGAENPALSARLKQEGVEVVEGCTLVMLRTDQY